MDMFAGIQLFKALLYEGLVVGEHAKLRKNMGRLHGYGVIKVIKNEFSQMIELLEVATGKTPVRNGSRNS